MIRLPTAIASRAPSLPGLPTLATFPTLAFVAAALAFAGGCDDDPPAASAADAAADASPAEVGEGDTAVMPDADAWPDDVAVDFTAPPPPPAPYPRPSYQRLAETGLYADFASRTLAPDLARFRPAHVLWSDAADKARFVRLPPGTKIDTTDMDHWAFPIGTKFWKEFSRNGKRLETRLIERYGSGADDYWMGAFVWNAEGTDAIFAVDGATNINGTDHDAPAAKVCGACHRGEPGRILGLSAVQMSRGEGAPTEGGLTLDSLRAADLLSHPPPAGTRYTVPGEPATAAALGYLHANCGHCHNENGTSWPDTQMVMRLAAGERDWAQSQMVQSLVGKRLQYWRNPGFTTRVVPGDPDASAILGRMKLRGSRDQMPPLATRHADPTGIDLVARWIGGLPP